MGSIQLSACAQHCARHATLLSDVSILILLLLTVLILELPLCPAMAGHCQR
jgi:hypothetical protein